mgnify:CR=1 FL=1
MASNVAKYIADVSFRVKQTIPKVSTCYSFFHGKAFSPATLLVVHIFLFTSVPAVRVSSLRHTMEKQ